jgi:hypothetical protein
VRGWVELALVFVQKRYGIFWSQLKLKKRHGHHGGKLAQWLLYS